MDSLCRIKHVVQSLPKQEILVINVNHRFLFCKGLSLQDYFVEKLVSCANSIVRGWRDSSVANCACCFCKNLTWFPAHIWCFQQICTLFWLHGYETNLQCTYTHTGKSLIHMKTNRQTNNKRHG